MFAWKCFSSLFMIACLLLAGCGSSRDDPRQTPGMPFGSDELEEKARVDFIVNFFPVQKALWIEDSAGNYMRSLHVSKWVSTYGEEYDVLPRWVEASSAARKDKNRAQIDAFTGATVRASPEKVSYYWDLTDWRGDRVSDGVYRFILQCDGAEGIVITWSADIEIGDEKSTVQALPDPPEHPEGLEMYVQNVFVSFHP